MALFNDQNVLDGDQTDQSYHGDDMRMSGIYIIIGYKLFSI